MQETITRRRPRISTTIADDTLRKLNQVGADINLSYLGTTIDYVVHDWEKLKRAAIQAADPERAQ